MKKCTSTSTSHISSKRQKSNIKPYDLDSLNAFKESLNKKKSPDAYSKLQLLKSELALLISDSDSDDDTKPKALLDDNKRKPFKLYNNENICVNKVQKFEPGCSSKFSDEAIDDKPKIDLVHKKTVSPLHNNNQVSETYDRQRFSLPDSKVEELIYKSFLIKRSQTDCKSHNRKVQKSNSKPKPSNKNNSTKQCKTKKQISRRPLKFCSEKRRRTISISSSDDDVQIVKPNISNSSVIYIDEDVNNLDWDEPFSIDSDSVIEVEKSHNIQDFPKHNPTLNHNDSINQSENKKLWECPVCFEQSKGQEVVATQCGHIFCKKCLENHFKKLSKTCPSCRCDLRKKPIITLFNF